MLLDSLGEITIRPHSVDGLFHVEAVMHDASTFCPFSVCTTPYPVELIERILHAKGAPYVCDEIRRDLDPAYVERDIRFDVFGYVAPEAFGSTRVLDFGSGAGASTMVLARQLPNTEIVGVELEREFFEVAELRRQHYGLGSRVRFVHSTDGTTLPENLGAFDYVFMNAVYEHLLPKERSRLLPMLWSALRPGGVLFVFQTPYRWFPIEGHTTLLPGVNYLPDALAGPVARRFSVRNLERDSWDTLLRKGIRGATDREILRFLRAAGAEVTLLEPDRFGLSDRIDLWLAKARAGGRSPDRAKAAMALQLFKLIKRTTGATVVPINSLAFRKNS